MSKIGPVMLGLSLAFAGSSIAAAQDAASSTAPVVLQITREFTKPYKGGAAHDKTESAFVTAQTKAKFPAYYVAMNSMTGKSRALFMTRYTSFAEWEKDNKIIDTNPAFSAEMERASIADGELLDSVDSEVFTLDRDLELPLPQRPRAPPLLSNCRLPREARPPEGMDRSREHGQGRARQDRRQHALGHVRGCLRR